VSSFYIQQFTAPGPAGQLTFGRDSPQPCEVQGGSTHLKKTCAFFYTPQQHLSFSDRIEIEKPLDSGDSQPSIGKRAGCHRPTICPETRRRFWSPERVHADLAPICRTTSTRGAARKNLSRPPSPTLRHEMAGVFSSAEPTEPTEARPAWESSVL
jgi:hypothetical protein